MACDLLGLNVVSVAKVLKFREMHVNRQGRISHIKCPRCGMKNGGMGRVGRHDMFFSWEQMIKGEGFLGVLVWVISGRCFFSMDQLSMMNESIWRT
jgi:hypothetical protein